MIQMHLPRTKKSNFSRYRKKEADLKVRVVKDGLGGEYLRERVGKLARKHRIDARDKYLFRDEKQLREFLEKLVDDPKVIEDTMRHEKAHYAEATDQGYVAQYGSWLLREGFWLWERIGFYPFIEIEGNVKPEEYAGIALAAEDTSRMDRRILEELYESDVEVRRA